MSQTYIVSVARHYTKLIMQKCWEENLYLKPHIESHLERQQTHKGIIRPKVLALAKTKAKSRLYTQMILLTTTFTLYLNVPDQQRENVNLPSPNDIRGQG